MRDLAICSGRRARAKTPSASTRSRKPPGGATRPSRRISRASSPTAAQKLDEAVAIAEEAAAARHDIFTEDALAWAYFKAGRVDDAKRTIRLALRTGTRDRDILRHAEAIGWQPLAGGDRAMRRGACTLIAARGVASVPARAARTRSARRRWRPSSIAARHTISSTSSSIPTRC